MSKLLLVFFNTVLVCGLFFPLAERGTVFPAAHSDYGQHGKSQCGNLLINAEQAQVAVRKDALTYFL